MHAVYIGDIADPAALDAAIAQVQPDAIVHLAALLTPECAASPALGTRVNCVGTATVFELAGRRGVPRVVFGSSVAALDSAPGGPQGDDRPLRPGSVYGATKAYGELLAEALRQTTGQDLVGLRFGWVYGPGRVRGWNALQEMIEGFAAEQPEVRYPNYSGAFDWTHVDDAAAAVVAAIEAPRPARTAYNVTGDRRTVGQAVRYLRQRFPAVEAVPMAATLPRSAWGFVSDGFGSATGFNASIRLEDGLERTVQAIRAAHGLRPDPDSHGGK